jgi:hypothetical protein
MYRQVCEIKECNVLRSEIKLERNKSIKEDTMNIMSKTKISQHWGRGGY